MPATCPGAHYIDLLTLEAVPSQIWKRALQSICLCNFLCVEWECEVVVVGNSAHIETKLYFAVS